MGLLDAAEAAYLDARDLADRRGIDAARGEPEPGLDARVADAVEAATTALGMIDAESLDETDIRAYQIMRRWLAEAATTADRPEPYAPGESWETTADRGLAALSARIGDAYAAAQGAVDTGEVTLTRLGVLERLGVEADPARRRELFQALEPTWRSIDGDGGVASPYQRMLALSAERWRRDGSPVDAGAAALGLRTAEVEPALLAILEAWRAARGDTATEPWDWWYGAGAAARALRRAIPAHLLMELNGTYHASLGADPAALGIGFDVAPRPGRPAVPVAYTDFGSRPRRDGDGPRRPATAWVMATYTGGGLGELTELVHETGHAIHVAAIDTRPAFADWPDSDAFTEALAELTALDTAEPAWQRRWLGEAVPEAASLAGRYAEVMLDVCWALLEIRLHADPERAPNAVWTELTSTYLGIVAHPELSWWAMRGQLVAEPGYMVNYALGPIIAADLRAAVRAARGDWCAGDSGWYDWVSAHVYRFGRQRPSGEVLIDVLGRAPTADALLTEIARGGGA